MRSCWESKLCITDANKESWKRDGENAEYRITEPLALFVVDEIAGAALEDVFETVCRATFLLSIVGLSFGVMDSVSPQHGQIEEVVLRALIDHNVASHSAVVFSTQKMFGENKFKV